MDANRRGAVGSVTSSRGGTREAPNRLQWDPLCLKSGMRERRPILQHTETLTGLPVTPVINMGFGLSERGEEPSPRHGPQRTPTEDPAFGTWLMETRPYPFSEWRPSSAMHNPRKCAGSS